MTCPEHRLIMDGPSIGRGYRLAWTIGPDGDAWPILHDTRTTEPQFVPFAPEHFADLAPHERLGRLPRQLTDQLGLRCGRIASTTGRPCRNPVTHRGAACSWHQDTTPGDLVATARTEVDR